MNAIIHVCSQHPTLVALTAILLIARLAIAIDHARGPRRK